MDGHRTKWRIQHHYKIHGEERSQMSERSPPFFKVMQDPPMELFVNHSVKESSFKEKLPCM